jgi:hypothetical protein
VKLYKKDNERDIVTSIETMPESTEKEGQKFSSLF